MAKAATKAAPHKKAKPIEPDVLEVLRNLKWTSDSACVIEGHCKIYAKVKKVLEALGGKWNRSAQATLFEGDGATLVRDAIALGEYIDPKQGWQFFETPIEIVMMMVGRVVNWLRDKRKLYIPDLLALEPSAGLGRIVQQLVNAGFGNAIAAVEMDPEKCKALEKMGTCSVINQDFLQFAPKNGILYDAIVMNPPFTNLNDVRHVMHAAKFLKPGGMLVAVMSMSWTFREDKLAAEFRDWLQSQENWKAEDLPPETFKSEGTGVRASLISFTKPLK